MVRKRGGRKRALGTRAPMALPQGLNQRWSLDFVSDALACGRKFRVLALVDDFSRVWHSRVQGFSVDGSGVRHSPATLVVEFVGEHGPQPGPKTLVGVVAELRQLFHEHDEDVLNEVVHRAIRRETTCDTPNAATVLAY